MRILVTGGTGFLGGALARRLRDMGADVTAMGRNVEAGEALEAEGIRFLRANLMNADAMEEACRGQEVIFHCGALAAPWGRQEAFYGANMIGTCNIICGAQKHQVRRLVHVSTPSIYFGYDSRLNVKEDDPLPAKQISHYAHTKLLAEHAIQRAHREGLPVITIRPRAIFGPGDTTVLPRLIRALETGRLRIIGNGRNVVDMSYIDNVVDALLLCMDSPPATLGRVYNITNGEPRPLWGIVRFLCDELGIRFPQKKLPLDMALTLAGGMEKLYKLLRVSGEPVLTRLTVSMLANDATLNIEAARRELGYVPRVGFDEGMARFVAWWKKKEKNTHQVLKQRV